MTKFRKASARRWPISAQTLRRGMAFACFCIGIAGCILPIIPGLPFFVLGGRLLGARDRRLRQAVVLGRQGLRRLRCAEQPLLRRTGRQLTPHWRAFTKLILGPR